MCWNAVVVSTKKITLAFFLLYQHTYTKAFYIWWHFGGYEMGSLLVIRIPQYTCTIAYKKTGIFVKAKKKKYILQLKYIRRFYSHPLGQSLQKKNTIRDGHHPETQKIFPPKLNFELQIQTRNPLLKPFKNLEIQTQDIVF